MFEIFDMKDNFKINFTPTKSSEIKFGHLK